jgi:hypothetical protein
LLKKYVLLEFFNFSDTYQNANFKSYYLHYF